ncbi:MAG: RICIN domain-containing protein, partial [Acidobacteriaceae bacterium]|nr:RICIN domain-containing protein [Acidobacteriaceae bacterium]
NAKDTATITIAGTNYTYTVQSSDTLASIVTGLVNLINASDPNVTASAGSAFTRVVLTAKLDGLSGGNGISVAGSTSANAQVTVTAYTSATCCAVTPNSPITSDNPAAPGELITVDAAGLGLFDDPATQTALQTGQPYSGPTPFQGLSASVDNSVSATLNGSTAQVIGAGFETGSVGHYSVQIIIPSNASTSATSQLYIAQNAFISNIVTLPVGPATILPTPPTPPPPVTPGAGLSNTQILVNPAGLLFATQNIGASLNKTQTITIQNPSSSSLTLNNFTITGPNATNFAGSWNCPGTLAGGQSCTITVTYTPGGSGVRTATLSVNDSAGGSPQTVSLTGTVVSSFVIVNKGSGKALDLVGNGTNAGTLIQQNDVLGSENQRWTLVPTGSGTYAIMNVLSGRALDVVMASNANGANIQEYDYLGFPNQQWTVVATPDGYNQIVNVASGKVLDVTGHSSSDGALIQQWDYLGADNQKWQFQTVQLFKIRNLGTGKVLDAPLYSPNPGTAIQQWDDTGSANQQWLLIPVDNTYYRIVNNFTGLVLDVTGASNANGTLIQEYTYLGYGNQLWTFTPTSSGSYTILGRQSGRVLDVIQASTADGTQIQQFDFVGGANQQWQLIPVTQ